jgi:hypothetical protein
MGQLFYKTIFLCQELLLLVALTTILSWYTPVHLPTDGRLAPTFFFTYEGDPGAEQEEGIWLRQGGRASRQVGIQDMHVEDLLARSSANGWWSLVDAY